MVLKDFNVKGYRQRSKAIPAKREAKAGKVEDLPP
jgi:hypothetical protein